MNRARLRSYSLILTLCLIITQLCVSQDTISPPQYTIDDFVRQLIELFHGTFSNMYTSSLRQKDGVQQHFSNLQPNPALQTPKNPPQTNYPTNGLHNGNLEIVTYPTVADYHTSFYLPVGDYTAAPYPPIPPFVNYPPIPLTPIVYRPPFNSYPQTTFVSALDSIARYDDLRCVPRLLCEVTAGSRAAQTKRGSHVTNTSFLSREALVTILTVLNFADDSPLLLFARAAFLGYSARGDPNACLVAYPTCPRNPDQLINYLNNHNGGFFRFFNKHYVPQYQQYGHRMRNDGKESLSKTGNRRERGGHGISSRILNDPIDIEYVQAGITASLIRGARGKVVFQNAEHTEEDRSYDEGSNNESNSYNHLVTPVHTERKFSFPDTSEKFISNVMIFPDRTGTGNLLLSEGVDVGHYKIVYTGDDYIGNERGTKKIKFRDDELQVSRGKMKFPDNDEQ